MLQTSAQIQPQMNADGRRLTRHLVTPSPCHLPWAGGWRGEHLSHRIGIVWMSLHWAYSHPTDWNLRSDRWLNTRTRQNRTSRGTTPSSISCGDTSSTRASLCPSLPNAYLMRSRQDYVPPCIWSDFWTKNVKTVTPSALSPRMRVTPRKNSQA